MRRFIPDRILSLVERTVGARFTYAQYGEDLIVDRALRNMGLQRPTYLDVGAGMPRELSNTALFYRRGLSGVCVEADPVACEAFRNARPRDKCINVGVGAESSPGVPFYVISERALSTFSRETADALAASGDYSIDRVVNIPMMTLGEVMETYCGAAPDFLSIDIEGGDLGALRTVDFERTRPSVICAETLTFSDDPEKELKLYSLVSFMESHEYLPFADTRVNTVFVDRRKWKSVRRVGLSPRGQE